MVFMLLAGFLGLVSFAGFIWLVVQAFKRHVGWGLAVLLLSPIAAVVFGIKHWHEVRTPFLTYAGSFAGMVALLIVGMARLGAGVMEMAQNEMQAEMQRMEQQAKALAAGEPMAADPGTIAGAEPSAVGEASAPMDPPEDDAARAEAERILLALEPSPELAAHEGSEIMEPAAEPSAEPATAKSHADLVPLVGRRIRVTTTSGGTHRGTLRQVTRSGILLDIDLGSGNVSYELDFDELDAVEAGPS